MKDEAEAVCGPRSPGLPGAAGHIGQPSEGWSAVMNHVRCFGSSVRFNGLAGGREARSNGLSRNGESAALDDQPA